MKGHDIINYLETVNLAIEYAFNNQGKTILEPLNDLDANNVLEELINNDIIEGEINHTNDGRLFTIKYVTIPGKQIMESLNETNTDKIKSYIKENGIPLNVQGITKLAANIFL